MNDPSGEKINYNIRPAKSIQRKMLVESLHHLKPFGGAVEYQYVGFGSFYFNDFTLFHKSAGIKNMFSIEHDEENKERYEFNIPFNCIEILWGKSSDKLLELEWDNKKIIWLDYDSPLDKSILSDIDIVVTDTVPGSIFFVSVDVKPLSFEEEIRIGEFPKAKEANQKRFESLENQVGKENIPLLKNGVELTGKDLKGWGLADVCKDIINREIERIVDSRNGTLPEDEKLEFKQLFHFLYKDSSEMLTFGGMLVDKSQRETFASCGFNKLNFIRNEEDQPYRIEVPKLTFKEIRYLNSQLPINPDKLKGEGIKQDDLDKFKKVYRYFPSFTEADI